MRIIRIDSLSLPELEPYLTMKRPAEHRLKGIFVAEGEKVVRRLVESSLQIVSILMTEEWLEKYSVLLHERAVDDGVYVSEKRKLEEIVGYSLHQGIMAIARVPDPVNVVDIKHDDGTPLLFVAVDGIANSENMGVIVRNCAALGVDALLVGENSCDPYLRRSVRNSMGTIFKLPIYYAESLASDLARLRTERAVRMIAAHPRHDSVDVSTSDLKGNVCMVFGSEGEGITPGILEVCDLRAKIPMFSEVDSINVATSVGVMLYEAARQRADVGRDPKREKS